MFLLEYAQYRNGEFITFIDAGTYLTREQAESAAKAHGLTKPGDDHVISEIDESALDYRAGEY